MKKNRKEKKKAFFKGRSITTTMFLLSFATIIVVLLIGSLIISVISPRVYCNSILNEIERNLVTTIEYYNIDLKDIHLNPTVEITEQSLPLMEDIRSGNQPFFSPHSMEDIMQGSDSDQIIQTINVQSLLGYIAISKGAVISISDEDGNMIYTTSEWFVKSAEVARFPNRPRKIISENFLLGDLIEDNSWVTQSSVLSLDEDYTLNVRLDLRTFNQNITIFNRIFIYMIAVGGIFAIIFSVILSFIVTKPLKELKKLAISMENMDFSVRYDKNRHDEIGQLGKTLNHMMERLGTTIDKLQAELQKEKRTDMLRKEFVAQVSHELKTPVAIVSNYTEALLDGVADTKEEQDSYLSTIENECHKMGHIINDLLDLSQMEAGTFTVNKSKFEFKDLVEDLIGKYENMTKGRFDFITDITLDSAVMYGDELRIEQALSNLLSNAIKHTKEHGFIKLAASIENGTIHIQVENEGMPISKDLMLHIWDSFTKGTDEKGAGLGLSITKNIVELHKGEYYVRNLENSVVFGIRLPLM